MLDFPSSPAEGDVFAPATGIGMSFVYQAPAWRQRRGAAQTLNRIGNPAFQISQQNVDAIGTVNGYYLADQWYSSLVAAVGAFQFQRVQWTTLDKSQYRGRLYVGTANSALAATDYMALGQSIEGSKVADFKWGTAQAQQVILRFNFYGPAGTYAVALRNSAGNRSWIGSFVQPDLANRKFTLVIPGDTIGVWPIDETKGTMLSFTLATGSTYQGVAGWQAGNKLGAAGISNGMGVAGNMFEISDVGLYLDPDKTGLAPPWVMPDEARELARCQRYWYRAYGQKGVSATATIVGRSGMPHPVTMRVAPAVAVVGAVRCYDGIAAAAITSINANVSTVDLVELNINTTGMTAGRVGHTIWDTDDIYLAVSARP